MTLGPDARKDQAFPVAGATWARPGWGPGAALLGRDAGASGKGGAGPQGEARFLARPGVPGLCDHRGLVQIVFLLYVSAAGRKGGGMYRRATSGGFIVVTTFLIVVVMALFTWVMYGMARQVYTMTDTMTEMNESLKGAVADAHVMAQYMGTMTDSMVRITMTMDTMTETIGSMDGAIGVMAGEIGTMDEAVGLMAGDIDRMEKGVTSMSGSIYGMNAAMNRMTMDVGRMGNAFSNPMSMMFPF